MPLCPPRIPSGLDWGRTWVSAARDRRLTGWAMTRLDGTSTGQVQNSWECDRNEECTQVQNFVRYTPVRVWQFFSWLPSYKGLLLAHFSWKRGLTERRGEILPIIVEGGCWLPSHCILQARLKVVEKDEISSYHSGAEQQPRRAIIEKY